MARIRGRFGEQARVRRGVPFGVGVARLMKPMGWVMTCLWSVLVVWFNLGMLVSGFGWPFVVGDLLAVAGYVAVYRFYGPPRARTLQWWLPLKRRLHPWIVGGCMLLAAAACLSIGLAGITADDCGIFAPNHAGLGRWFGNLLYGTCLRYGPVLPGLACIAAGVWLLVRLRLAWPLQRRGS